MAIVLIRDTQWLVNISTLAIHGFETVKMFPAYCASKNSGTLVAQLVAQGVSPDDMQVLSFHPGAIYTDAVQSSGIPKEYAEWDDGTTDPSFVVIVLLTTYIASLPAHYAVWAASEEAKFLHGRFTWAAWDVDELKAEELKEKIDKNPTFLQIGVVGLS